MTEAVDPFSDASPFFGYTYSYPHKTAHRRLSPGVPLSEAWRDERRDGLFLYLHVPFCEHRCGFCNLFTLAKPDESLPAKYLDQLHRQATAVAESLGDAQFARIAVGGGTPTILGSRQLDRLFDVAEQAMGARPRVVPISCEASPAPVTPDKLALLRDRGVDRLSLGVQTFDDVESWRLRRPQQSGQAAEAIEMALAAGFPIVNVDLVYGAPGQSLESWARTVRTAMAYQPQEFYLYPLYVRPLTALGDRGIAPADNRLEAYRLGRSLLLDSGYRQVSLRMFQSPAATEPASPTYRCQVDGMVGLGCGARSYTGRLHYSSEYAVGRANVRTVLGRYLQRTDRSFLQAEHGIRLDGEDRRRRFAILGLLPTEGLSLEDYHRHFQTDALQDLPQLQRLIDGGLAERVGRRLRLTDLGIERSDAVGPWLYSRRVRKLMGAYQWR